ncbi:MAG TPA: 1-(5-phosphoribosyl)-5-[(5-phosphoribosylamino)methylideneamino] imidazole-4-carboxamide isomerase [Acidimicrobiales bacterium]|nr:1-(5-phosphoribosyl)-5-[(5-phosphoribosylamino)methylideneamino] imidazole-4-carboxamide isomerase [Acidimicrobiales bacterium]
MDLYPSIDLRGGCVVRLVQGDFDQETDYALDPVDVARDFAAQGAPWIHVVDLDAALGNGPVNRDIVAAIADAVEVPVQIGGGQSDDSALKEGVQRIVLGSVAVKDPGRVEQLAAAWPGRVAVGIDARDGEVAVRGWTESSNQTVSDLITRFSGAGVAAFVITDIGRDGLLAGPDAAGLTDALAATDVAVIASGGVSSLDDIRALAALESSGRRLAGAITGRAVYERRFTVAEAVAITRETA